MNRVVLMGRLTRDPDVRYSQGENARAVARYTLAVDRRVSRNNSDGQPTADFISCVSFGQTAEFIQKYFSKGSRLCGEGRIQTGSYQKDGQTIYTTDVVIDNVEFCESRNSSAGNSYSNAAPASAPEQSKPEPGFINIPEGIEEELPFN